MFDTIGFFHAVITQDASMLREFFHADAWVEWICTNEHFTVDEYLRANCEYPGNWSGCVERMIPLADGIVLAARVWPREETASFHVVSFMRIREGRIASMEEYWADDSSAPEWRQRMHIGKPIGKAGDDQQ